MAGAWLAAGRGESGPAVSCYVQNAEWPTKVTLCTTTPSAKHRRHSPQHTARCWLHILHKSLNIRTEHHTTAGVGSLSSLFLSLSLSPSSLNYFSNRGPWDARPVAPSGSYFLKFSRTSSASDRRAASYASGSVQASRGSSGTCGSEGAARDEPVVRLVGGLVD